MKIPWGNFIALSFYFKKIQRYQISNLMMCIKFLEKQEQATLSQVIDGKT